MVRTRVKRIHSLYLTSAVAFLIVLTSKTCKGFDKASSHSIIIGEMDMSSRKIPILREEVGGSEPVYQMLENNRSREEGASMEGSDSEESSAAAPPKKRSKRFIFFNSYASLDFGFLLTIPFTIVLPPMSNLFNNWKNKRSVRALTQEDQDEAFVEDSPVIQPYLDRVSSYFELIKVR
jgi:hypothetical protein